MLQECRCSSCKKLLGKVEGRAEIVCIRCKVLNAFNVPEGIIDEMSANWYGDQWKKFKQINRLYFMRSDVESRSCSECAQLYSDGTKDR